MPFSLGGRHAPRVNLPIYNVGDLESDMHSASDEESSSQSDDEYASDYNSSRCQPLSWQLIWLMYELFKPRRTQHKDQKNSASGQKVQAFGIVEAGESCQGHVAQEKEPQPPPNNATRHLIRGAICSRDPNLSQEITLPCRFLLHLTQRTFSVYRVRTSRFAKPCTLAMHSRYGRVRGNDSRHQIAPEISAKDNGHLFYSEVDARYVCEDCRAKILMPFELLRSVEPKASQELTFI